MQKIVEITNEEAFDDILKEQGKVLLVDFWAPWCGPCRVMTPVLEKLVEKKGYESVYLVKVNVDENKAIAQKFQVRGIPTVLLFSEGQLLDTMVGAVSEQELEKFVSQAMKQ